MNKNSQIPPKIATPLRILFSLFASILLFALFFPAVFSQSFQEFDQIENPTASDLSTVPNPTIDDFSRLSPDEQQQYLLISYNADFAADYLAMSADFSDKNDRIIAEQYYSDTPDHINDNPTQFTEYMNQQGITITLKGPVIDYENGVLTGTNQVLNVNQFRRTPAKDYYNIIVGADGTVYLQTKSGAKVVQFTGTLQTQSTGKFTLTQGTIHGVAITNGKDLDFNGDGNIDGGTVTSYGGITFSEPTVIKTEGIGGTDIVLQDAKIKSFAKGNEGSYRVITGNVIIEDYNAIDGAIRIPAGKTLQINEVTLKAQSEPVTVEIDDQWWFEKYADPIKAAFGQETEGSYVQLIKRDEEKTIETQGGLKISMNAQEFVTGTASEPEDTFEAFSFDEAKNGVAYRKGDAGNTVQMIQEMLMNSEDPDTGQPYLNPTYTTKSGQTISSHDGLFGALTEEALKAWQEDKGIKADGKFGKGSLTLLQEEMKGTQNVDISTSGKTVLTTDGTQLKMSMRDASLNVNGHQYTATKEDPLLVANAENKGDVGFPITVDSRNTAGDAATGISANYRDCSVGTAGSEEYLCQTAVEGEQTIGAAKALGSDYLLEVASEKCSTSYTRAGEAVCTIITNNEGALNVVKKVTEDMEPTAIPEQAFPLPEERTISSYSPEQKKARDNLAKLGLSDPDTAVSVIYTSAEKVSEEYQVPTQTDDIAGLTMSLAMVESYLGEPNEAGSAKLWRESQYAKIEDATGIIPDRVSLGPMQVQIGNAKANAESVGDTEFNAGSLVTFEGGINAGTRQATKLWKEYEGEANTYEGKVALTATAYNIGDDAPRIAATQQQLANLGYKVEVTGLEDDQYQSALEQYQQTSANSGQPVEEQVRTDWEKKYNVKAPTAIPVHSDYVSRVVRYCARITGRCHSDLSS
ncbi:peptidoglycan-binding protein [Candidatus Woesearchaeota archaeon]|nr:peptidoglycan-binding protein [Candidatus Woesearchaeota archaeon]